MFGRTRRCRATNQAAQVKNGKLIPVGMKHRCGAPFGHGLPHTCTSALCGHTLWWTSCCGHTFTTEADFLRHGAIFHD